MLTRAFHFAFDAAFANAICNPIAYQSQAEKRQQQLNALLDEEDDEGEVSEDFLSCYCDMISVKISTT